MDTWTLFSPQSGDKSANLLKELFIKKRRVLAAFCTTVLVLLHDGRERKNAIKVDLGHRV
jgi:hypothetical protein